MISSGNAKFKHSFHQESVSNPSSYSNKLQILKRSNVKQTYQELIDKHSDLDLAKNAKATATGITIKKIDPSLFEEMCEFLRAKINAV